MVSIFVRVIVMLLFSNILRTSHNSSNNFGSKMENLSIAVIAGHSRNRNILHQISKSFLNDQQDGFGDYTVLIAARTGLTRFKSMQISLICVD